MRFQHENRYAAGPDDVWAVGNASTVVRFSSAGGVTRVPIPRGNGNDDVRTLWAIWGAGPNAIWAAGVKGTIIRWNGKAWRSGRRTP